MYFLVYFGCNRIVPMISSVRDNEEKIRQDICGKINIWTKEQIQNNIGIDIDDFDNDSECKFVCMGKITDLDFFKESYRTVKVGEPCICMPIMGCVLYNPNGDAISVIETIINISSH